MTKESDAWLKLLHEQAASWPEMPEIRWAVDEIERLRATVARIESVLPKLDPYDASVVQDALRRQDEPSVEQLAERINAAHKSVDDQFAKEAYESSAPAAGHWAKLHQWGQDKDYHWYQSCPCSRCSAHTAAIAREQQDHLARGETSWISTIDPP